MMHVDKNADEHVMDQNVDRISREIAYVPLGGGIRSKRSSCMHFFFFFLNEYKTGLPEVKKIWRFWSCVSEDQRFWILAHVFRGLRIFWALAHIFRGPKDLGSCFKRTKGSGSWLMFSKPRIFGLWLMFLED